MTYDYEAKPSYSLAVNASDGKLTASTPVTVNLNNVDETPPITCFNQAGTITETAEFDGDWEDADCRAHHQDSRARYFHFTLDAETDVTFTLLAGALYVSSDTPKNGWGTEPGGTYEHRKSVRRDKGKLLNDGGKTATLTLGAGDYTAEVAQTADGSDSFTLTVSVQATTVGEATGQGETEPDPPANQPPAFEADAVTTLLVDENSPAGTDVGAPLTATDPDDGDTVSYSLSGDDAASFAIGASTGQIATKSGGDLRLRKQVVLLADGGSLRRQGRHGQRRRNRGPHQRERGPGLCRNIRHAGGGREQPARDQRRLARHR